MPNPSKFVLHVRNYCPQTDPLHREPATLETWHKPAVDSTTAPTRITVFASTSNGALDKANSYLALLHARRAWEHPDSVPPTAADVIYAAARRRFTALTARERESENNDPARHERHPLQASALYDVMRERDELS
ncbi:hypothetical protein [Streptomyces sp. NPDC055140]